MDQQIKEFGGYKDYQEHEVMVVDRILTYLWNKRPLKDCPDKIAVWQKVIDTFGGTKEFALLEAMDNWAIGG